MRNGLPRPHRLRLLLAVAVLGLACDPEPTGDDAGAGTAASDATGEAESGDGSDANDAADAADDAGMADPACAMDEPACQALCTMVCNACGQSEVQGNQCESFKNGDLAEETCLSCKSRIAMWAMTCETMSDVPIPDSDPASCPDDVERGPECQALYECCLTVPPEQAPACENNANSGNENSCAIVAEMQYC